MGREAVVVGERFGFVAGRRSVPVFVDDTGRKRRRFRGACGTALGVFSLYVALVVVGLTGHGPLAGIHLGPFGGRRGHAAVTAAPRSGADPAGSSSQMSGSMELAAFVERGPGAIAVHSTPPTSTATGSGSTTKRTGPSQPITSPGPVVPTPNPVAPPETAPTAPGKSGSAPGHNKTTSTAPGRSAAAPGRNKTITTGKSAVAPGQNKAATPASKAHPAAGRDPKRVAQP